MSQTLHLSHNVLATLEMEEAAVHAHYALPSGEGWTHQVTQEEALKLGELYIEMSGLVSKYHLNPDTPMGETITETQQRQDREAAKRAHKFTAVACPQGGAATVYCIRCGISAGAPKSTVLKGCPFGEETAEVSERAKWDMAAEIKAVFKEQEQAIAKGPAVNKTTTTICTANNPMPANAAADPTKWEHFDTEVDEAGDTCCVHCGMRLGTRRKLEPGDQVSVRLCGELHDAVLVEPAQGGAWQATLSDSSIVFVEDTQIYAASDA